VIKIEVKNFVSTAVDQIERNCEESGLIHEIYIEKEYDEQYDKIAYVYLYLTKEDEVLYRLRYGV